MNVWRSEANSPERVDVGLGLEVQVLVLVLPGVEDADDLRGEVAQPARGHPQPVVLPARA